MKTFNQYLQTKFKDKKVIVDCFNMKQVQGKLEKICGSFIVVNVRKSKLITIPINAIAFVQEAEE